MANSPHDPPGKRMKGKHLRTLAVITPGHWSSPGEHGPAPEHDLSTPHKRRDGAGEADDALLRDATVQDGQSHQPDAPDANDAADSSSFTHQIQILTATHYALLARFGQFVLGHPAYESLVRRLVQ